MTSITIESTNETPRILFNVDGNLSVSGISTPNNVNAFYQPLFDWIKEYKTIKPKSVSLELFIDYLNTSSTRIIVEMIRLIKSFEEEATEVNFIWLYDNEDEDMLEMGEEFESVTNASFIYKTVAV